MQANGGRAREDLLHWRGELAELVAAVRRSGPARSSVRFDRGHAAQAVRRVLTGDVAPEELVAWAQAVHFEEDVEAAEGDEDLLTRFLFEVSSPELFAPLTDALCRRWLDDLDPVEARRASSRTSRGGVVVSEAPSYRIEPVGYVESPLSERRDAPKQGFEGAPDTWLVFRPEVGEALRDLRAGDEVYVLTWLHQADRGVLRVHPRDDPEQPERGVFGTRSPDRPNPVGLHRVRIAAVDGLRLRVHDLEAIDGTPLVDVKPLLRGER
ncbi:tRNA (N6-threonylcarbamoyladenosine(37)-N6)-methyltransferase TrmO [Streptomyces sp. JJ36]|uniref:tRNA (N6-threonylcarbamoyladenosine(37)-N6)-methyltransferase TrmO n=1 Tax=Streptomyces sp. JJ36 TaxID=2736645 RepID=UPI001F00C413|nr:tRNA (N6-threonylcarbamoyladenosine(37)-N6)-methyltransferase TrmO [Streptomyces sp. JJ36]MCF6523640.1 tRNA (N6-threonylcarbamoyladenosine(37)-N6)-methyltransferase TrmO [Streptomyces sp. JJ36]